jgi:hypothetical protein
MAPVRCFQAATSSLNRCSRPISGSARSLAPSRLVQCRSYGNDRKEPQQQCPCVTESRRSLLQQIALGAAGAAVSQLPQGPAFADEAGLAQAPAQAPASVPAAASTSGNQRVGTLACNIKLVDWQTPCKPVQWPVLGSKSSTCTCTRTPIPC